MIIFAVLAAIGLALGLTAHVAAILGSSIALLGGKWLALHFSGVLAVLAAMLASRRCKSVTVMQRWPKWVRVIYGCAFFYAAGNFFVLTLCPIPEGGVERRADGSWAIINGGRLVREISAQEAQQIRVRSVRAQSGVWNFFHGAAAVSLAACAAAVGRQANQTLQWTGPAERSL
jgi:hypothetical protein